MESIETCWKCGALGHHRQSCRKYVTEKEEYVISRLCKRLQIEAKGHFASTRLPEFKVDHKLLSYPVKVLEKHLDEYTMLYSELISSVLDVGRPVFHSANAIKVQKADHHRLNMKILEHRKTDEKLLNYSQNRHIGTFCTDDEKETFMAKMQDYFEIRRDCYNLSNKYTMWCWNALSSVSIYQDMKQKVDSWIITCENFLLGRPTLESIEDLKKTLEINQRRHFAMKRESQILQNICKQTEVSEIVKAVYRTQTRLRVLSERVAKLDIQFKKQEIEITKENLEKGLSESYREMQNKVSCILCMDNQKELALPCGHMYCNDCLENLEKVRTIEDGIRLPRECAFCKGPLAPKLKLFF